MNLPLFLKKLTPNFEIYDVKEWLKKGVIEIYLTSTVAEKICARCNTPLSYKTGKYSLKLRTLPILQFQTFLCFFRDKGYCPHCKKVRSEKIDFISEESPHMTKDYVWWLGRLCEIAPVSRVAQLTDNEMMTLYRIDQKRLQRLLQDYKIPKIKKISVDEVYARKKVYYKGEMREARFFTIISDIETRKVIWVSDSRNRNALDEFYKIIGPQACKEIEVVAMDQHTAYRISTNEYCPQAVIVYDRFHLMKGFEEVINKTRQDLHADARKNTNLKLLTKGQYRYIFLKKAERRSSQEEKHIEKVLKDNNQFAMLEIIKERMFTFFDCFSENEGKETLNEIGNWANECKFELITKWYYQTLENWNVIKNWFKHKYTTALSEGINNVIKVIKRRAYGYRNMSYFRLKIMQVCGYLNSKFIPYPSHEFSRY
jgi:transposase